MSRFSRFGKKIAKINTREKDSLKFKIAKFYIILYKKTIKVVRHGLVVVIQVPFSQSIRSLQGYW